MSLLVEGDSLEVKAIKLHLAAAKHKVSIAKEHAEWSNYQLDESKKHLKDTEKKLREAKRRVDILDHNAAADNDYSKQEGSNNKKRNATDVSSNTSGNNNQQTSDIKTFNNVLVEDDTISDEQTLKKCGSCDVEKKRWSYLKAEWDKKRKTTDTSEEAKKAKKLAVKVPKQLSKSAYDKARREAMKAGTWKPDPRYQPKPKPPPHQYQLPSNPTTMSGGSSSGIEMLTKAAESDLLHSLFQPNTHVAEDDNNNMDEDTTEATQLDITQTRSGRKITPSSKKKEATTKNTPIKKPPQKRLIRPNTQVAADDNNIDDTTEATKTKNTVSNPSDVRRINDAIHAVNMAWSDKKRQLGKKRQWGGRVDFTLPRGITPRPSGKYQTQLYFAGKSRYIGIFDNMGKASLAYEIALKLLKADDLEVAKTHKDAIKWALGLACKAANIGVAELEDTEVKPLDATVIKAAVEACRNISITNITISKGTAASTNNETKMRAANNNDTDTDTKLSVPASVQVDLAARASKPKYQTENQQTEERAGIVSPSSTV